jgi:hypothetical protein
MSTCSRSSTQTAEVQGLHGKAGAEAQYSFTGKDMLKFLEEDDALNKGLMTEAGFVAP